MRRTKWDASGPETCIDVSSASSCISSSTNIEAVKALAKKRLEELMAEKNNTDSNESINISTCNSSSTYPNINVLIAQASASIQEKTFSHTKGISQSVQKAAAIAAAFQSTSKNSYLDTVPQIPPGMQICNNNNKTLDVLINNNISQNLNINNNNNHIIMTQPIYPPPTIYSAPLIPYNNQFSINTSICQFSNDIQNMQYNNPPTYIVAPVNNANIVNNNNNIYSPYLKYNKCIKSKTSNDNEDISDDDVSNEEEDTSDNDSINNKDKKKLKKNIDRDEEIYDHPKYEIFKFIFGTLPKQEDEPEFNHEIEESANGMFTTDIDINFSNAKNRLVRKEALQEIRLCTGAAVLCRGKIKTDVNSSDKGLYLRITGDTKEKVKDAALLIEKLMIDDVKKVCFINETNNENFLEFFFKQKAELKEYLDYIMKSTKAYIEIRGTGSNHTEDVNTQEQVPLHLMIYGISETSRIKAELLSRKLIDYINKQFEEELKKKQMQTSLSQQQLGATFNGPQVYQNQQQCNAQNIILSLPQYSPFRYNNMNMPIYNNSLLPPNNVQPYTMNPLFIPQRQLIPQPVPPLVNYGLSWKDLLNDEQEQSRRRKEMEEKKKKREQERDGGRKRIRSSSRSSSRSRSPSNDKRSSKLKNFNSVPPPNEFCKTHLSSINAEDTANVTHNEITEETDTPDDQASPIKEPNPCNKSDRENETSSKIFDAVIQENDEASMPPPPPINFLMKNKSDLDDVCAPSILSSKTTVDSTDTPCVDSTEEFGDDNADQKSQQPVALVAYDDDSEED